MTKISHKTEEALLIDSNLYWGAAIFVGHSVVAIIVQRSGDRLVHNT